MYGLLGKKLNHSHSPFVHNSLCRGIDYSLIEIEEDKLENFLIKKELLCINVTFPYKEKVIDYLDELNWTSKTIGSVNLIINKNNKLIGYNTDYYGFKESLKKYNFNVTNKKCLILGTGGTAKTIRKVLIDCGAREIYLVSRSNKKGTIT